MRLNNIISIHDLRSKLLNVLLTLGLMGNILALILLLFTTIITISQHLGVDIFLSRQNKMDFTFLMCMVLCFAAPLIYKWVDYHMDGFPYERRTNNASNN